MIARSIRLAAALVVAAFLVTPTAATADGFTTPLPPSGVALTVWDGGSVEELAATYPEVGSVWVAAAGALEGYLVGAPGFVNGAFLARYPNGEVPAGTPMLVVVPAPAPSVVAPSPVGSSNVLGGRVFDRPIEFGPHAGGLFVAEQDGTVLRFATSGANEVTMLDIRDRVSRASNEEGLLSVAFDASGNLWAYYSAASPRRSVLSRFTVAGNVADPNSELVVLELDQPFSNHNGGAIRFGPDGMLYLGFGDGGSGGDPLGAGQDLSTLLGKVIRIDVSSSSASQRYQVPADNPFVNVPGAQPEIWALGLRNPWRMAFDPQTGALWVGDVGQSTAEEIAVVARGQNHGWNTVEGNTCHQPSSNCDRSGLTGPRATYGHSNGRCSVTGGVVYRGAQVPELRDSYVYGDFCSGEIWGIPADGSASPIVIATGLGNVSSFGTDANGEVYVLRFGRPIARLTSP